MRTGGAARCYLEAMRLRLPGLVLLLYSSLAVAEPMTIAVASNFRVTAGEIVAAYTKYSGSDVRVSVASTSKLYAQIRNGAPFDVFLAADSRHPRLLQEAGFAVAGSRRTYATGGLVLWSRDETDCRAALDNLGKRRLAIANPQTAPYGVAAQQFLVAAGLWEAVEPRLVYGENVGQAMQFAATRNAQLGLVAASQAADPGAPQSSCAWRVPAGMHDAIEQQLVVLQRGGNNPQVAAFVEFLGGDTARGIMLEYGYGVPE